MRYWHNRLNRELFRNSLRHIKLTYGSSDHVYEEDVWGFYMPDEQEPYIHIAAKVRTKRMLIDTLCHEMVHQLQNQRWQALTHGRFFNAQAKRLLKHDIVI